MKNQETKAISTTSRPFSIRMRLDIIEHLQRIADESGFSANSFVEQAVEGILEMIEAPEGKLTEPKVVAVARFMRQIRAKDIKLKPVQPRV